MERLRNVLFCGFLVVLGISLGVSNPFRRTTLEASGFAKKERPRKRRPVPCPHRLRESAARERCGSRSCTLPTICPSRL